MTYTCLMWLAFSSFPGDHDDITWLGLESIPFSRTVGVIDINNDTDKLSTT